VAIIVPGTATGAAPEQLAWTAQGLVCETFDRVLAQTSCTPTSGDLRGGLIPLRSGQVVTSLNVVVNGPGTGMTHGSLALYDTAGNLIRSTADAPATFQSAGLKTVALTTPYTQATDGAVVATCFLTTGTTMPTIWGTIAASANITGAVGSGFPRVVSQTGLASQPNPATFAVATALFWLGAS
jgi:hypothetical protein